MNRSNYKILSTFVFFFAGLLARSESAFHDLCPQKCSCSATQSSRDVTVTEIHVNCSGQKIRNVSHILSALSNETTILDLSTNFIKSVEPNQFSRFPNLDILLLQNNLIREIEPYAFKGLRLQRLDLHNNKILTIRNDAFFETSASDNCRDIQYLHMQANDIYCGIDLRQNPITKIERNAFAWMKRLSVHLGNSTHTLNIEPYAFYGAQEMTQLVISDIPSISLHARLFTNVEGLKLLEISNTHVELLKAFAFEGLKRAERFNFTNVSFAVIESFAFSGINFVADVLDNSSEKTTAKSPNGGQIIFHKCSFQSLPTDAFRDINLAQISFSDCDIDSIQSNAFRGISALQNFRLSKSRIKALAESGFGSLRNLDELSLEDIELDTLVKESFLEVSDVTTLRISVATSITIDFEAFSGCLNIGTLDLSGSKPGVNLNLKEGAFNNFVSVDQLLIKNFSLPSLEKGAFQGMTKIKHLKIEHCNVSQISKFAFGETYGHQGAIESLTMDAGNSLMCNCQTTSTIRQLRYKFFSYSVRCTTEDGQEVEVGNQPLGNDCTVSGNNSTITVPSLSMFVAAFVISWLKFLRADLL